MLTRLHITDFALIKDIELTFGTGLNIITGETGAGKSILVGAISLALGARAKPNMVEQNPAIIEAEFRNPDSEPFILKREIRPDGRSKAWINGSPCTITELRDSAEIRVDLTAQREGATLLDPVTHLHHLDRLAGLTVQVAEVGTDFQRWQTLREKLRFLEAKLQRLRETEELASFQLQEIEEFQPEENEATVLDAEIRRLEGAESLLLGLAQAVEGLDQGDDTIIMRLGSVAQELKRLTRIDDRISPPLELLEQALTAMQEASRDLDHMQNDVELDPERLEELRDRRGHLSRLIRKYGGSMETLLENWQNLQQRQSGSEQLERDKKSIEKQINDHIADWESRLLHISEKRSEAVTSITARIREGLKTVGVAKPEFKLMQCPEEGELVRFPKTGKHRVGPAGWDRYEFHISFNPGQPVKPVQDVASGGELSRIMLLLKSLSPAEKTPPALIFDEIDTGISGRTARQVGLRLKELSTHRQVLLVTHLPQIASLADHHLVIEKQQAVNSTTVLARPVDVGSDDQVDEIARLVGGEELTDAARAGARELITEQH